MQSLIAPVEQFAYREKTKVIVVATAGSTVQITVENNQGFSANDYVVLKTPGNDQAHIAKISSVSANNKITVDTLKHNLYVGDEVIKILFNKMKFYGRTATGTYTEMTLDGSPKDIEVDNPNGTLFEYTGTEGYIYFKVTYYNSTTAEETSITESNEVSADQSLRYCSIYSIRKIAGLVDNEFVTDERVESKRKIAESEINSVISLRYSLPLTTIPDYIKEITMLLAGGYLSIEEFGDKGGGIDMVNQAKSYLKSIQKGENRLIDISTGEELSRNNGGVLSGYPDSSTEDTNDDVKFKMNQTF